MTTTTEFPSNDPCNKEKGGYLCTRDVGHGGNHVARTYIGLLVAAWTPEGEWDTGVE